MIDSQRLAAQPQDSSDHTERVRVRTRSPSNSNVVPIDPMAALGLEPPENLPVAAKNDINELAKFSRGLRDRKPEGAPRPVFYELKQTIERRLRRQISAELTSAQYRVAEAVVDRTLEWGDLAKIITWRQFATGVRDQGGALRVDTGGTPIFSGVNLRERYIRTLVDDLLTMGLIDRLPLRGTSRGYLYFPARRRGLAAMIRELTGDRDLPALLVRWTK